ncbi:MAG: transglutaminase family protein [Desulfobulbales bacterium]|nr:transglutaminase family protein [Desulfobulbales bacterium]
MLHFNRIPALKCGISLLFIIVYLAVGAALCRGDTAGRNYGSESPPFWYPLTSFERETLAMADQARRGERPALLRIALMGAGVRDEKTFQGYSRKITAFLDRVEPELARIGPPRERGRLLHEKMHSHLLLPASRSGQPYGYSLDQSSLAVLLDTGRFNCTSSALLYLILAGFFDLEVRGVVVPNHVFVELRTGNGGAVDIETTASDGFARIHDREFYRRQAEDWAAWRGLQPVTYRDYQQREFITPLELAAMNMDDQHVRQGSMDADDRLRLKEAQSLLMVADRKNQLQRLGLYNNEYNRLSGRGDYATLVRMFTVIGPVLDEIGARWREDPAVAEILSWLYYQQANAVYRAGDLTAVPALMDKSLDLHRRGANREDRRVRDNNLNLLAELVKRFLDKALFAEALSFCDGYRKHFHDEARLVEIYRMIYSHWGDYHWQRGEWDEALAVFAEELTRIPPTEQEEAEQLRNRITSGYLNRGTSALRKKEWRQALDFYLEGLSWTSVNSPARVPEFRHYLAISYQGRAISHFKRQNWAAAADDFARQLDWADDPALRATGDDNLKAVFSNWKNDYIRNGDLAGAENVLRQCIERFPGIDSCREQLAELFKFQRM